MSLIEIRDMVKIYNPGANEVRALNGISLSVEEGEFLAIIGQSGSGKSTLMNMLGCLDTPTAGTYYLDGQNVATLSERRLSYIRNHTIGFIFQGFHLIPGLTALENVIENGLPVARGAVEPYSDGMWEAADIYTAREYRGRGLAKETLRHAAAEILDRETQSAAGPNEAALRRFNNGT